MNKVLTEGIEKNTYHFLVHLFKGLGHLTANVNNCEMSTPLTTKNFNNYLK